MAPSAPPSFTAGPRNADERDLDTALERLRAQASRFARQEPALQAALLRQLRHCVAAVAEDWARTASQIAGVSWDTPPCGESWIYGPVFTLRALRLLERSLADLARERLQPGNVRAREGGGFALRVHPESAADHALTPGASVDVFVAERTPSRAQYYREPHNGRVAVVLGAGNVSSIAVLDAIHHLFSERSVVLLKLHPLCRPLQAVFERALKPLIEQGVLAIVSGGPELGSYACHHREVDTVHITGSSDSHEAIVWGPPGADHDQRRQANTPFLKKRITSELGSVTPVVLVPGPYSRRELDAVTESLAGMFTHNAAFNCISARLLVLPRGWVHTPDVLAGLARCLERIPTRRAYYPGAETRYQAFTQAAPELKAIGAGDNGTLPWALALGLNADDASTLHFRRESFCSVLGVTELGTPQPGEFLRQAVEFCNERVWGTLSVMLCVPPALLSEQTFSKELDDAVANLHYGTVAINQWSALAYGLGSPPWGARPPIDLGSVKSGLGWVHNTGLLDAPEKCVVRGPLLGPLRPIWSPFHRNLVQLGRAWCAFEAAPSLARLAVLGRYAAVGA
jgi:acyl-CoA reductase-like NAD-dependent aldehyde dehydrogenase